MSDTVIRVENLGKKYLIDHQEEAHTYKSMRDVIANGAQSLLRPFQKSNSKIQNPKQEEFWALKDVNFEIKQGDRIGIIGRNGAGKSTLLKLLSRITEPSKGRIQLEGRVASLLEVGTGFHPELTGRENIYLNGAILGMSRVEIKKKFDEIVAFAEVEKFLDTPVKRYSSGMYVRLAFAVAAHLEPEILIVDEVLAVGDAQFQKKCLGKMEDVAEREGRTILFVSHNMLAIRRLCNQSIFLKKGRFVQQGKSDEIIDNYLNELSTETYLASELKNNEFPYFLCACLENASGKQIQSILTSESAIIRIDWYVPEANQNLRVGIGINSSDELRIFGSLPEDCGKKISGEAGRNTARVTVPAESFLQGKYSVCICLWDESTVYDFPDPAFSFIVEPDLSSAYAESDRRQGLIHIPCQWDIANDVSKANLS